MARPRKPYQGVLRRRMPSPLDTPIDECLFALHERFVALAEHYGLDWRAPEVGLSLWFNLALDHVEGFQVKKKPGAKPTPGQTAHDIALWVEVLKAQDEGRPASSAYRRIVKRRRQRGLHVTEAALRKRFSVLMKKGPEARRMLQVIVSLNRRETRKKL